MITLFMQVMVKNITEKDCFEDLKVTFMNIKRIQDSSIQME